MKKKSIKILSKRLVVEIPEQISVNSSPKPAEPVIEEKLEEEIDVLVLDGKEFYDSDLSLGITLRLLSNVSRW